MRRMFTVLGLSLLAASALACGSDSVGAEAVTSASAQPSPPATATIGQPVTLSGRVGNDSNTVEITVAAPEQHTSTPNGVFRAERGTFLVATVTAVCAEGTYHANPFNFRFVGADGTSYEGSFASFDPALQATDLSSGQRTSGKISFDVPVAAIAGGRIQVDAIGADPGSPAAYWTL